MIILALLSVTGCQKKEEPPELTKSNTYKEMYELYQKEDGTLVYASFANPTYLENKVAKNLKQALENKEITLEEFLDKLTLMDAANDGGSLFYETNDQISNEKYYVAKCNSMKENGGIHDTFIVKDKAMVYQYCTKKESTISKPKLYYELKNQNIYMYELEDVLIENVSLKTYLNNNMGTIEDVLAFFTEEDTFNDGGTTIYKDGGSKEMTTKDIKIIACHTLDGNQDLYFGPKDLKFKMNFCQSDNRTLIKTYEIQELTDKLIKIKDELGTTHNIKMNNQLRALEKDKTYLFEFSILNDSIKDTPESIFENASLVEIKETTTFKNENLDDVKTKYQSYKVGDKIKFHNEYWYVIKNSSIYDESVTVLKENKIEEVEQTSFYECPKEEIGNPSCSTQTNDYEKSYAKKYFDEIYLKELGKENLKNIGGNQIRLLTYQELIDLGCRIEENTCEGQDFLMKDMSFTMTPYQEDQIYAYGYTLDFAPFGVGSTFYIRPVIHLYKSKIEQ